MSMSSRRSMGGESHMICPRGLGRGWYSSAGSNPIVTAPKRCIWRLGEKRRAARSSVSIIPAMGDSGGAFEDGCIGDWAADAQAAIETLTKGPQVLVGSSMGGWIALLIARARPDLVAGLVGIAAAPDFTEDSIWAGLDSDGRAALEQVGRIEEISEYGPDPYVYTRRLIMDGREQLVLRNPLPLPFPVRLLQGTADADVDQSVALRLLDHAIGDDIRLTLVKGADHRFSSPPSCR